MCITRKFSFLTRESDNTAEVIFLELSLALFSECLDGEGRVSGEGAQAGEKVGSKVRASRLSLLGPGKTNGGTQYRTCRIYREEWSFIVWCL